MHYSYYHSTRLLVPQSYVLHSTSRISLMPIIKLYEYITNAIK